MLLARLRRAAYFWKGPRLLSWYAVASVVEMVVAVSLQLSRERKVAFATRAREIILAAGLND